MVIKKKAATKKNISFESLDSVDLNKKVDLEAGKDAVQTEAEKAKKTSPPLAKEKAAPPKAKAKPVKEELIRVTVDLPKSEHKKLKIRAMEEDEKLYEYVLRVIRASLKS
jgi:hypothetical protein